MNDDVTVEMLRTLRTLWARAKMFPVVFPGTTSTDN